MIASRLTHGVLLRNSPAQQPNVCQFFLFHHIGQIRMFTINKLWGKLNCLLRKGAFQLSTLSGITLDPPGNKRPTLLNMSSNKQLVECQQLSDFVLPLDVGAKNCPI